MKLVFFGSGAFGLPTLRRLAAVHDVILAVSQPDRPAGRSRAPVPTPVSAFALERGIELARPERITDPGIERSIRAKGADAFVVIAYGQKLGPALLDGVFAINLHGSLLPRHRGAAPIGRAIMEGDRETGVTVITLADRMDAGLVLASAATPIDPMETAGELHDRLAEIGPELVLETLRRREAGALRGEPQDESRVTRAPRLEKADGTTTFDRPALEVQRRVHGLTPWPGCRVRIGDEVVRLARVRAVAGSAEDAPAGTVARDGAIACRPGAVRILSIQPAGRSAMSWAAFLNGRPDAAGAVAQPIETTPPR